MHVRCVLAASFFLAGSFSGASAQDYPTRTIRIVVPAAAGGSLDILGRLIATRFNERWGQPALVDNRAGAGQMIGAELVAKAPADGHTLLVTTTTYVTSAAMRARLPFDPVNDLAGVGLIGSGPFVVVVHPSIPVKTLQELIRLARMRPSQINYASAGTGSIPHMAMELLAAGAQIQMVHVPYKSLPPAVTDTVAGHVQMMIGSLPSVWPQIKTQRLRALACTSRGRSSFVPDLPTISESGVPGYDVQQWWGMYAPGKTPKEVVAKINAEMRRILALEDVKSRLASEGAEPAPLPPEAFSAMVAEEIAKWRKVIGDLNIRME